MHPEQIYRIYGLKVRSELSLPAMLAASNGEVDLVVRDCGLLPRPCAQPRSAKIDNWQQFEQGWRLRYHTDAGEVLEFLFNQEASRLGIRHTRPALSTSIGAVLVGPAMAAVFHLRRIPVLHASAVALNNEAILVAGPAGAGKSTLTAALLTKGAPLLAEDLAVLTIGENVVTVQPGYPRLRLCPDATIVAGQSAQDLPRVFNGPIMDDKRWVDAAMLAGGFRATPAPLGAIYLLALRRPDTTAVAIEPLPPHRAGLALLDHLYGARWLRIPKAKALEWCARIAGRTPVRVVHAPFGLERVRDTADAIIADSKLATQGQQRER